MPRSVPRAVHRERGESLKFNYRICYRDGHERDRIQTTGRRVSCDEADRIMTLMTERKFCVCCTSALQIAASGR
jgi:hypothetical protein